VLGSLYADLARVHQAEEHLETADDYFQRAISTLEPVVERSPASEAHGFLAAAYFNYGHLLKEQGAFAESLEFTDKCLAIAPESENSKRARDRRRQLLERME
jgi:tetratricopeptide (TPR) repeat protein